MATRQTRLAAALPEFLELLRQNVHRDVFDEATATEFHERFGPFDPKVVADVLSRLVRDGRRDQHLTIYLEAIRNHHGGDRS